MGSQSRPTEADVLSLAVIENVRVLRAARGWSISELERRIVVTGYPLGIQGWRRAENGRRCTVGVDELWALGQAFSMSPLELVEARDMFEGCPDV